MNRAAELAEITRAGARFRSDACHVVKSMRQTQRLGRYHLTERIAYGGMAEIFRGFTYEDGFRKDVAIKKLLPHYAEDHQFIDMLTDEFKLVSHLRHPNIAEVYELVEVDQGVLFIAMEYVDGKDLRSTVEKARSMRVPMQFDDIAYLMARALEGLHHAHVAREPSGARLEIVHRDFSPSNILVGYDATVKICDFGIAKATHNRVQTKTGIIKGKVKYMSPEQAFGRKLDWRSDVFSAGSVLYELCTAQAPFTASNEIDLIFQVRDAAPRPPRDANPHIPTELADIIERAMVKSRSGRYQSCLKFREALIDFLTSFNAKYRKTRLSRLMKNLWAAEIEQELRLMEAVVLDTSGEENYGRNLIADALGPGAEYSKFNPHPTRVSGEAKAPALDEQVHEARTAMIQPAFDRRDDRTHPDGPEAVPDAPTRIRSPRGDRRR